MAHAADWDKPGWQLTFQDEFDGTQVDATKWVKRYKWGEAQINGELQAYVDDAFQVQNGILSIVGEKRTATYAGQTFQYASGVLSSVPEQMYGYFEARSRRDRRSDSRWRSHRNWRRHRERRYGWNWRRHGNRGDRPQQRRMRLSRGEQAIRCRPDGVCDTRARLAPTSTAEVQIPQPLKIMLVFARARVTGLRNLQMSGNSGAIRQTRNRACSSHR